MTLGTALEFLYDLGTLKDEVLKESYGAVALSELFALGGTLLLAQSQLLSMEACLVDALIHLVLASPGISQPLLANDAQAGTDDKGGSNSQQDGNGENAPESATMQGRRVAQTLVLAFLCERCLIVGILLLQGLEIKVFGMNESFVDGCLGRLGVMAPQGYFGKTALYDISRLHVIAGTHSPIDRLGLIQRIAAHQTTPKHL